MRSIMANMANGMDSETAIMSEELLYAVQRMIQCERTGTILDVRNAILYKLRNMATRDLLAMQCVTAEWWDAHADDVKAACVKRDIHLEVIDGRVLAGKRVGYALNVTEDAAMTAIVGASTDYAAREVCATLRTPVLCLLLDLLHVDTPPTARARMIDRIVKDARS